MISLWWFAMPVLLLPIWWHRQKRERASTQPLATARFLPSSSPLQRRVWRIEDPLLLVLRCLLLATVLAWLADLIFPWRGDAVVVTPGTDSAWIEGQVAQEQMVGATRIELTDAEALAWLARHEREWKPDAKILVLGQPKMPAVMPQLAREVTVRTAPPVPMKIEQRVSIASKRQDQWRALFAALDGPQRYQVLSAGQPADLIIWDLPEAPPAGLRAPLWWVGDATAFPELKSAKVIDGVRYADSARGRLWSSDAWPAADAETARAQFETWQRLHYAPVPWPVPDQRLVAASASTGTQASGALRHLLTIALLALFTLERILTHAKRR